MTSIYRKVPLGHEAIQYIKDCLKDGKTLSNLLLDICYLDNGQVFTYLPSYLEEKDIKQFKVGGKIQRDFLEEGNSETDLWLFSEIRSFLIVNNSKICVFEHALARPNDPWISLKKPHFFSYTNEVYIFLSSAEAESEKIEHAVRAAVAYLFIGVMTSMPYESCFLRSGKVVTYEELKALAEKTERIIVGAYDYEGYIIWSKESEEIGVSPDL
jgi:hypothetical protein